MSHTTITLEDDAMLAMGQVDDPTAAGWWIDHHTITVQTDTSIAFYRLPKGKPRIALHRLGRGRAQLVVGGFTTTTVVVNGPTEAIEKLREEVL